MRCNNCLTNNTYVKTYHHEYLVKNRKIEFDAERRFCHECNNLVYDRELDNNAGKLAISIYNKKFGIVPEKILELRKKYGLSQQQFSKIIGCAKKTLVSYELGNSIPNDIYMITLKTLINNPDVIIDIFDANKERFSEKEYKIISSKIKNVNSDLITILDKKPSIYNGFTKFIPEKVINLILILSDKGILKTKLLKEMFYCDFLSYKNTGASITGLEYAKLPFGPVPDSFDSILNLLTVSGNIDYEIEYENNYESHYITKNLEENKKCFSKEELKIINKIKEYFQNYNSKDIVNYSHKEKAFIETEKLEKISYEYAFDIDIDI